MKQLYTHWFILACPWVCLHLLFVAFDKQIIFWRLSNHCWWEERWIPESQERCCSKGFWRNLSWPLSKVVQLGIEKGSVDEKIGQIHHQYICCSGGRSLELGQGIYHGWKKYKIRYYQDRAVLTIKRRLLCIVIVITIIIMVWRLLDNTILIQRSNQRYQSVLGVWNLMEFVWILWN